MQKTILNFVVHYEYVQYGKNIVKRENSIPFYSCMIDHVSLEFIKRAKQFSIKKKCLQYENIFQNIYCKRKRTKYERISISLLGYLRKICIEKLIINSSIYAVFAPATKIFYKIYSFFLFSYQNAHICEIYFHVISDIFCIISFTLSGFLYFFLSRRYFSFFLSVCVKISI